MDLTDTYARRVLAYVVDLQSRNRDELGFLPRMALQEYIKRGQVIPAVDNDYWVGYVLYYDGRNGKRPQKHPDTVKIHQICVQHDARRILNAARLLANVETLARKNRFQYIKAWVATDIEANAFWRAMGYHLIAQRLGGQKRNRVHNLWCLKLPAVLPVATAIRTTTSGTSIAVPGVPRVIVT